MNTTVIFAVSIGLRNEKPLYLLYNYYIKMHNDCIFIIVEGCFAGVFEFLR